MLLIVLDIISAAAAAAAVITWTNSDPLHLGFKFQIAVLAILYLMFLVELSFVLNLLKVFLVWIVDFSLTFCYYSDGSNYYRYNHTFHVPQSLYLCT